MRVARSSRYTTEGDTTITTIIVIALQSDVVVADWLSEYLCLADDGQPLSPSSQGWGVFFCRSAESSERQIVLHTGARRLSATRVPVNSFFDGQEYLYRLFKHMAVTAPVAMPAPYQNAKLKDEEQHSSVAQ